MGIRGLCTFFDMNPEISKRHRLHDTNVIIDGNNLLHKLYFDYRVECTYGGDYHRFASVIKSYFSSYSKCNITPIVIFDGGYDKSDRKLRTTIKRAKCRLSYTKLIEKLGSCSVRLLPVLALEMFKDVIQEIGITYAQCDFEADDQITAIANYYKCPVISQDSDFYIFDIYSGFIRLDLVETSCNVATDSEGKEYHFLSCRIFFIDNFLSFFPGIDKSCLPLFSILSGNDYVDVSTFESFFKNIKLPKFKSRGLKVGKQYQRMLGLLAWLKRYNLDDGIQNVLSHTKKNEKARVEKLIGCIMSGYNICASDLISYLDTMKGNSENCNDFRESKLTSFNGNPLPLWFGEKFQEGNLSPFLLNIVGLRRVFLPSQIEDTQLCGSYNASLSIRKVLYGLLLSDDVLSEDTAHVEEYDRQKGSSLQKMYTEPTMFLEGFGKLPGLSKLHSLDSELCKCLIMKTLGEDCNYLNDFPDFLQLLIACIRFWLKNCKPKPTVSFYNALVITIIFLSIVDPLIPKHLYSKEHNSVVYKPSCTHSPNVSLVDMIKDVSLPNALFFGENMKKYFQKPVHNHAKPIILHIVHSFSQLQACFLFLLYLNKLLSSPFLSTKIQAVFSGTMLYNMTRELMSRTSQDLFISGIAGRGSVLHNLFEKLKEKILENIPSDCLQSDDSHVVNKKRRKHNNATKICDVNKPKNLEENENVSLSNKISSLDINLDDYDPAEVFL